MRTKLLSRLFFRKPAAFSLTHNLYRLARLAQAPHCQQRLFRSSIPVRTNGLSHIQAIALSGPLPHKTSRTKLLSLTSTLGLRASFHPHTTLSHNQARSLPFAHISHTNPTSEPSSLH
ncbi:unnamed protein product [Dovyalis caffra]|uniref:Uncharacterized protein n=1 Tax=Dovyalis caffra TaxID=77055 RepID=A0AAV1R4E1_9ROSI|nr:unnamed protein product [Dovyalis caffra]